VEKIPQEVPRHVGKCKRKMSVLARGQVACFQGAGGDAVAELRTQLPDFGSRERPRSKKLTSA
jgi:hypothetical protein